MKINNFEKMCTMTSVIKNDLSVSDLKNSKSTSHMFNSEFEGCKNGACSKRKKIIFKYEF